MSDRSIVIIKLPTARPKGVRIQANFGCWCLRNACAAMAARFCCRDVANESNQRSMVRRVGVFGDLPTRLLRQALRVVPWFLEPVLIPIWTFGFFLIAGPQRRAVMANLRAMHPPWGAIRAWWGAWQVFRNFGVTYVDGLRCETQTGGVDWEIEGLAAFRELAARQGGCILLTAHMGNYDVAAPMFSGRFRRTLHAVRAPERESEMQALREREMREKEARHPHFRTLYNGGDKLLGIELARLLAAGDVVAVQGDRVIFDVSPMEVEIEPGLTMRLPKGPLFLARATRAPVYPLFIVRTGWRRYRVMVFPELTLPPRQRGGDDSAAAAVWARAIYDVTRQHWQQWYVFESVLMRRI
jgi:lauroyl/myristoyl acyltransferase